MNIVEKKVGDLIPYDKNPRDNSLAVQYVMESIKQFGFKVPMVIDKYNVIICGHTRLLAAKKLKLKTVPCIVADDLTQEQIDAYRLADNRVAEFSSWDFDMLQEELLDIENIDMEKFLFQIVEPVPKKEKMKKDEDGRELVVCPKCRHEWTV